MVRSAAWLVDRAIQEDEGRRPQVHPAVHERALLPARAQGLGEAAVVRGDRPREVDGHAAQISLSLDEAGGFALDAPGRAGAPRTAALVMPNCRHEYDGRGGTVAQVFVEPQTAAGRELCRRFGRVRVTDLEDAALDAARAVHLPPSRLRHRFVAETGTTFRAFALWVRIQRDIERMMAGESRTEAAHAAGFADSAHLSRIVSFPALQTFWK